jgi:hypothetical protein
VRVINHKSMQTMSLCAHLSCHSMQEIHAETLHLGKEHTRHRLSILCRVQRHCIDLEHNNGNDCGQQHACRHPARSLYLDRRRYHSWVSLSETGNTCQHCFDPIKEESVSRLIRALARAVPERPYTSCSSASPEGHRSHHLPCARPEFSAAVCFFLCFSLCQHHNHAHTL